MATLQLGLIGIVNEIAKEDRWGTMAKVAEIGYQGIEGAEWLLEGDAKENLKRFHDLGLRVLTVSSLRESLRDDLPGLIAKAKALECDRVSMWWAGCETREEILQDCELYNQAGKALIEEGIKLCYHNHDHEFRISHDGANAMSWIAANTDPKCVFFELDVAWITYGGEDPIKVLGQFAGRVPAIHIKDVMNVDITRDNTQFTAVGTGLVDIAGSVHAGQAAGAEWMVVEQDRLRNLGPIETIQASYLNLKEAGLL